MWRKGLASTMRMNNVEKWYQPTTLIRMATLEACPIQISSQMIRTTNRSNKDEVIIWYSYIYIKIIKKEKKPILIAFDRNTTHFSKSLRKLYQFCSGYTCQIHRFNHHSIDLSKNLHFRKLFFPYHTSCHWWNDPHNNAFL